MSVFEKAFADTASAAEAARRSMVLRSQGLLTPTARVRGTSVLFDRIKGTTGLPLLKVAPERWLRPLIHLHGCALTGLSPLDPVRRIRPRNGLLTSSSIRQTLNRLVCTAPRGCTLLHGDFHLGQLIQSDDGVVWMIDLDDLCLGPPEAELGNLIANIATQDALPGDFRSRLTMHRRRVTDAWERLAGPVHRATLDHHLALALIRRHLKLRETGRADFEAEIAAWVTPVACRISPSDSAGYPG